jgi:hypothetical protein
MFERAGRRSTRCRPGFVFAGLVALVLTTAGGNLLGANVLPAAATSTTTTTRPTSDALHEFVVAKREWEEGAFASSFQQSYYFKRAATFLSRAISDGASDVAKYVAPVRQLRQLAALPETSDTAQQRAQARGDLRALNSFFDTKDLYG